MASLQGNVGLQAQSAGAQGVTAAMDRQGGLLVSALNPKYSALSMSGKLYFAHAIVTAPVIYSTAAGTGGPLLWNPPGSGVNAQLIAAGVGVSTASTVAAALGITGGTGQNLVPSSTTAIDGSGNAFLGGAAAKILSYRVGTVTTAGAFLIPFGAVHTGALTVDIQPISWVDLAGVLTFGPGSWASIAASATASTTVATLSLLWVEHPI